MAVSSCSISTWGVTRSRNGMLFELLEWLTCDLRDLFDITQNSGRISSHDTVRGNVLGDHAAGADNSVLTDCDVRENSCARSDRCAFLDYGTFDLPVCFGLQISVAGRGARVGIVDKGNSVADENVVLNDYAFTNKCVAGDFAALADASILLDLHECANLGFIADFAPIQVDELGELDVLSKLYIWRDAYVWIHSHWLFVKKMLLGCCERSCSIGFGSGALGFVIPVCEG